MNETDVLLSYLDGQRRHVLGILEGLDEEALRRPVLPSGWNCLGLVRHLALHDERFWFRCVVAGDQQAIDGVEATRGAWHVGPEMSAEAVLAEYREEIARANEVIATASLDGPPAWWPTELFGDWRLPDVRHVMLHVITETACHAGHLDAVRELIDGRTWLVLPE